MNAPGEAQARLLAERLAAEPVARTFTSPLARAARTAAIVGHVARVPVEPVAGLRETDFGAWEGLRTDEIAARYSTTWRA
jgi:broad specificity phosphatase PhoE